jgi:hypothetical protein
VTAEAFHDGIVDMLTGDDTFTAAIATLLGAPVATVITANIPIAEIPAGQFPCFVVETGDMQSGSIGNDGGEGFTIGNYEHQFNDSLDVVLVWQEPDRERAGAQRRALKRLFPQLLMRNPCPGGIASAWVERCVTDQGGQHPTHVFAAQIRGDYSIPHED